MDNGLIFPYHSVRAQTESDLLRKAFGPTEPIGIRLAMG